MTKRISVKAIKTLLTTAVLMACMSLPARAQQLTGYVSNVIDGNTIEIVTKDNETYKIFLHGIDSPEPGQSYSDEAKKLLERLLLNKPVEIALYGRDRSGNRLGLITVEGKPDPRHELVKAGLAWTAEKEDAEELKVLEEQARLKGKGLWQEANPVPPWTYRRMQTLQQ